MSNELVLDSVAEAAAVLDHAHQQVVAGELAIAEAIAAMCDLHRVDETAWFEGMERWVDGGADGAPKIGEFVAAEIAALLGCSIGSAFERIRTVLNLRHRHPRLWEGLLAGELRWWEAARVADAAADAGLDAAACARFDRMCAAAMRVQPWQRVYPQVAKWIIRADPALAAERYARAAQRRYVAVGHVEDGHTQLWGQLDGADGIALHQALDQVADQLDGDTHDHRRASALGVMARSVLGQEPLPASGPGAGHAHSEVSPMEASGATSPTTPGVARRTGTRRAELVVRVDATDLVDPDTGVADIDGWGHVLTSQLGELLTGCQVTVRPVINGADLPAQDGYQPSAAMRLALEVRNPVDVFPYGVMPARRCQVDHTIAFTHADPPIPGQTHMGNLGPLSSFTHRAKTHGGWYLRQPLPGIHHWRSPLGYEYLVTAHGTVMIRRPSARCRPPRILVSGDDPPSNV